MAITRLTLESRTAGIWLAEHQHTPRAEPSGSYEIRSIFEKRDSKMVSRPAGTLLRRACDALALLLLALGCLSFELREKHRQAIGTVDRYRRAR